MADIVEHQDDERDDELFREVYSKEYTGPPRPIIKPGTRSEPPARKRSHESDDDEKNRERDPYGVPRDFTSREARTWEARNRAIEKQQKRKLEEELRCRICGEMGHFAQGCPNTLGQPRGGGGGRQGEEVEKIPLQDQRLKSRIIGAKGAVIQGIEKESGCRLRLEDNPAAGDGSFFVRIIGKREAIPKAAEAVNKLVMQYEEEKKTRPLGNAAPQLRNQGPYSGSMDGRGAIPGRGTGMGQLHGRGVPLGPGIHGVSGMGNDEYWASKDQYGGAVEIVRQQDGMVAERGGPAIGLREEWSGQPWAPSGYVGEESYHGGAEHGQVYSDSRVPAAAEATVYQGAAGYGGCARVEQELPPSQEPGFDVRKLQGMNSDELDRWLQEELMRLQAEKGRQEDLEHSRHQQALEDIKTRSAEQASEVRSRHLEAKRHRFELQQQQQQQQYNHPAMDQGYYSSTYVTGGYGALEQPAYVERYGGAPGEGYVETQSGPQNGTEVYSQAGYGDRVGGGAQMFGGGMIQRAYGAAATVGNGQEFEEQRGGHAYLQEGQIAKGYTGRIGYEEVGYEGEPSYGYGHEGMAR